MGKPVLRRVAARLGVALATLLLVTAVTFALMHAAPGNPWLGEKTPSAQTIEALNEKYGQDRPLAVQLVLYLGHALRGDLGVSVRMMKDYSVAGLIGQMLPLSALLGALALGWSVPLGLALGWLSARRPGGGGDRLIRAVTALGLAAPEFVVAACLLALLTRAGAVPMFPAVFSPGDPLCYVLPCFSLGLYPMCRIARQTRAAFLEILGQDYMRAARGRGLSPLTLLGHGLRGALIPVLASLGPLAAYLLTGSFVVERAFGIPGLGRYYIQSILNRDYPLIMGTTLVLAALLVGMNLLTDLLSFAADPRMGRGEGEPPWI